MFTFYKSNNGGPHDTNKNSVSRIERDTHYTQYVMLGILIPVLYPIFPDMIITSR